MPDFQARYAAIEAAADPVRRQVARRQLARLTRARGLSMARGVASQSRWVHVPLNELFAVAGNLVHTRDGRAETGHEPVHRSRSGRCVVLWPDVGRWWCSSCRRGGDAVSAVMSLAGVTYSAAIARLIEAWGAPAGYWDREGRP